MFSKLTCKELTRQGRSVNTDMGASLKQLMVYLALAQHASKQSPESTDIGDDALGRVAGQDLGKRQLGHGLVDSKSLHSPVMTAEELAGQLRDNPRLAKAIVDAWIDTNNDGVITGSEILGRK